MAAGYPKPLRLAMGPTRGKHLTANARLTQRDESRRGWPRANPSHPALRRGMRMGFDAPGQLHLPPKRHHWQVKMTQVDHYLPLLRVLWRGGDLRRRQSGAA